MYLVLLGPPGSGKGTQGARIAEHYCIPHIATGDIVRDHIARHTEFGRKVEAAIAGGNFAPDSDIQDAIRQRIAQPDAKAGYVLDGFPRDLAQAAIYQELLSSQGQELTAALDLQVPESELIERLSGRLVCPQCRSVYQKTQRPPRVPGVCDLDGTTLVTRPDDQPDAIKHRLDVYYSMTKPLSEYYAAQQKLISLDATGTVEKVTETAIQSIEDLKISKI